MLIITPEFPASGPRRAAAARKLACVSEQNLTRRFQIAFAVVLVFSAAQAGWWMLDQSLYVTAVHDRTSALQRELLLAAEMARQAGVPADEVAAALPGLRAEGERLLPDAAVGAALDEERDRRLNRYFWEGGFFLAVLVVAIAVLGRAVRQESQLRRRQQNFLAAVGHELKSPIASSRVAAETLELRDPEPAERRKLVGRILRNLGRLESMVGNLLDTARLESGTLGATAAPFDLVAAVQPVLADYRERAEAEGVELVERIEAPAVVLGDAESAAIILRNLLANGFTAVADAPDPIVAVSARRIAEHVRLQVEDNGCGFEPSEARRLFEKFYRPGDEMRRGGQGTGLGLYIVQELASRSGATATAHSDGHGSGARFSVDWRIGEEAP